MGKLKGAIPAIKPKGKYFTQPSLPLPDGTQSIERNSPGIRRLSSAAIRKVWAARSISPNAYFRGFPDSCARIPAGVFTNLVSEMNSAFNHLEVGGVIINDVPTFRVDHMPYGGVKESGMGREGVKYAIREMLEPRLLVKNIN
ncbi:hypothetical protein ES708_31287 [subsurface metagenome]